MHSVYWGGRVCGLPTAGNARPEKIVQHSALFVGNLVAGHDAGQKPITVIVLIHKIITSKLVCASGNGMHDI